MLTEENIINVPEKASTETLDSYIKKKANYNISHKAKFTAFKYRSKVEFLRFFIV